MMHHEWNKGPFCLTLDNSRHLGIASVGFIIQFQLGREHGSGAMFTVAVNLGWWRLDASWFFREHD